MEGNKRIGKKRRECRGEGYEGRYERGWTGWQKRRKLRE